MVDSPVFRPIRTGQTFEETVERLLQAAKLGVINPGERLPSERELAAALGVARETLREALRSLVEAGYFESVRGRGGGTFMRRRPGAVVSSHAGADTLPGIAERLGQVLDLRRVLEVGAAELAATRDLPPADRTQLRWLLDESCAVAIEDYRPIDSRLHLAIAEASGSPTLAGYVADVRADVNDLLDAIPRLPVNIRNSNLQHRAVMEAVLDGDAPAAREAMTEHLAGTAALLRGFLESTPAIMEL
ncbi:MAG: FadR family transcriptional regulator [Geodermatophilaceae bacterium]|nr:FadR family transcriptional regulator [Geodermatophilaceae bacterium]